MHTTAPTPHDKAKVKVLLVDDEPANLQALAAILEDPGLELVLAHSGNETLRFMLDHEFAAVLLDVHMPALDGFETATIIRGRDASRHTPIIFVTAYETDDLPVAKAYSLGAVDYLVKPLVAEVVRAKVAVFVELFRLREADRKEQRSHLATNFACAQAMAAAATESEGIGHVLHTACEGMSFEAGTFWSAADSGSLLNCTQHWHMPSLTADAIDYATHPVTVQAGEGVPGRAHADGKPVWVGNLHVDSRVSRLALGDADALRGAIGLPVVHANRRLGVLEFLSRKATAPAEEMLHTLMSVATQLGQFIQRTRTENELRRSQRELADFVENAAVGLHWVGPDGIILWANRAELELLGYASEEYIGQHISEFHADPAVSEDILERLANKEELHSYEAGLRCKDGSIRHVLLSSNVLWDKDRFCHTRCFTRDITERKQLEESLRQRAEELAENARRKDQFLAMLAHELRNPLAPVLNGLQILRLTEADQHTIDLARDMMERQVFHLKRLIDDLLDVSRVTRGMIQVNRDVIDLAALVQTAVEDRRSVVEQTGMHLNVEVPDSPVRIIGDATRLAQVLNNLLDNSVKFRNGGSSVSVRLSLDQEQTQAVLEVRDQGIGIGPELFPRLFDAFAQADRTLNRSPGGLGLGLSLVKGLVELHGGSVEAASGGPGQGAVFTIRLPLKDEKEVLQDSGLASAKSSAAALRILIVEDNRDGADSLEMLLELMGHDTQVAYTGPEGVRIAKEWHPDVVLCDIGLPGLDGYSLASELRGDPATARTSLIAITGYGQIGDRDRARKAGFNHHLTKPVEAAELQPLLTRIA
ncbi:MAG TPA: response regulator [Gemmataceae bacterium]|nr:response regulator [Gemmataceae bacterium]